MSKTRSDKPMTAEERHALVMKPFPTVRVYASKGNSQAPAWVKRRQDVRQDKETGYELEQ